MPKNPWLTNPKEFIKSKTEPNFGLTIENKVEIPFIFKFAGNIKKKKILELGCGNGDFVKKLHTKGGNIIGVDFSTNVLDLAKDNYPNLKFELVNLENNLPFSNSTFDIVVGRYILSFVNKINRLSDELYRVLKYKGKIIFTIVHPFYPYILELQKIKSRYSNIGSYSKENLGSVTFGKQKYPCYFRPTEIYINTFLASGFELCAYKEVVLTDKYIKRFKEFGRMDSKPIMLILGFKK